MFFTRETDYAIRLLRNLSEDTPTSIARIAACEHISNAIGYKVARKLEKSGLIRSTRGSAGGYRLARPLAEITLLDVYHIMDPQSVLNECLKDGNCCPNNTEGCPCKIHGELVRVEGILHKALSERSLAEILEE